ncbi:hypothetical protein COU24_00955 [Candidatus Kuenenbacteria bacterium CG10_big_fil_rev_8_21_14_0_10_39_14]|uniref:Uncharacterized protein n=6 Tax=Parcubacteria group TaxID=1794811 RepID=A0A2M7MHT5_9BACT|nr:MAG: hypothetical protein COU24_00955 [Candidatus Kuenenbacteria bacterium CG10_big_fil_rev_8_21_14_0_10_39_14]PIX92663.1 MAG: hypothetical protein COZ26_00630 [Candidatus Kuenenbacteria bacterium CG_4_10_14_3_um_filter_39_14]
MFNQEQIKELLKNKNVDKCSPKSITYNGEFKIEAVRKYYHEGYGPSMIFQEAGFDLTLIGKGRVKDCLKDWRRIYNHKGEIELTKENRGGQGGRSQTKYKDDKEKIAYLETKIAYLEEENHFLKKMKKLEKP